MPKFRLIAICRTCRGTGEVMRILDARDAETAKAKFLERFAVLTFTSVTRISAEPEASPDAPA